MCSLTTLQRCVQQQHHVAAGGAVCEERVAHHGQDVRQPDHIDSIQPVCSGTLVGLRVWLHCDWHFVLTVLQMCRRRLMQRFAAVCLVKSYQRVCSEPVLECVWQRYHLQCEVRLSGAELVL